MTNESSDGLRARLATRGRVENVAPVHGDDERHGHSSQPHRLAGGHRVVGMDQRPGRASWPLVGLFWHAWK